MQEWLALLRAGVAPELVWGVLPRIVGGLFFVAFASLATQILGLSGSRGISPVREQLATMRAHYPGPGRFVRLPTLLWLDASDFTLRALPCLGMAAGLFVVYGGPGSHLALFACYALYLSFDIAALIFPWDCLLFEASILTLFLPEPRALPDLHASSLPLPLAAFAFRFLLIRLMWGFAKLKFFNTKRGDAMYLRGFLAWLPMCTPLGFAMQHGPAWFLRISYFFMWFSEVVCPGLAFFRGELRVVAALGLMGLMAGIWATGNWGFFNLGYGALCFALLDTQSSVFDMTWAQVTASPLAILVHVLLGLQILFSVLYFPNNSWGTHAAIFLPFEEWSYTRRWVRGLVAFFRVLMPFRTFHAYGVFPPNSSPPIKMIPVFEGSLDGVDYRPYRYRFMPCLADSRAPIVAPHHPRVDHLSVYAGSGMTESDYLSSVMGAGKPYGFSPFSHYSWLHRIAQRLLEGSPDVLALFGEDPFAGQVPKYCRVSLHALTPAGLSEARKSGEPWRVQKCGTLISARENNPNVYKYWLSPPELFHPDNMFYRHMSPALKALLATVQAGTPLREAVRVESDIRAEEVARFWDEFVPLVATDRGSYERVDGVAAALYAHFGEEDVLRQERIAERYVYVLRTRLEPYFFGNAEPRLKKGWNMILHLLAQEMILDGEQAYAEMLAHPERAAERAARTTPESQLHFLGVVRNETLRYHGRTLRIARRMTNVFEEEIPGILEFRDLLTRQKPAEEVWLPELVLTESGEWRCDNFGEASPAS
jgi:Lipase maturation factor